MSVSKILDFLNGKKIVIVGFGREGVSSYKFLRKHFPQMPLVVADKSPEINTDGLDHDDLLTIIAGEEYDQHLNDFDLIFKSPGVNLNTINYFIPREKFTSQAELFLMAFGRQIIGVTGTKGKSTTASLIYHILSNSLGNTILVGNIGIPFFDLIDKINDETTIVAELSAHQLEFSDFSPHVAIMLNLFQEHLDHFNTFNNYQLAKLNITEHQSENDIFIYNFDDRKNNPGLHNNNNIMAAVLACKTKNVGNEDIIKHLKTFKGLEHRIELVGTFNGITFYNDSISTIPEATVAALKTVKRVDTLIIGGFDRGIDYQLLIDYLKENPVRNIAFVGKVGERVLKIWQEENHPLPENYIVENDYAKIVDFAFEKTQKGCSCLLSPAAASYDQFKDFTVRGTTYKNLIIERGNK